MAPSESSKSVVVDQSPCNAELEGFLKCVKEHPAGLKETDCEEFKVRFRKCFKRHVVMRNLLCKYIRMCAQGSNADVYDFPPLFTLQPNLNSRKKQFGLWVGILQTKAAAQYLFFETSEIFHNARLGRRMEPALFLAFGDHLVSEKLGEWKSKGSMLLFYHKPLSDWATIVHDWATKWGKLNGVESLLSLRAEPEFREVPPELLLRAVETLEKMGKCEVFFQEVRTVETCGVKFFP